LVNPSALIAALSRARFTRAQEIFAVGTLRPGDHGMTKHDQSYCSAWI
jgi:hypothetical protein